MGTEGSLQVRNALHEVRFQLSVLDLVGDFSYSNGHAGVFDDYMRLMDVLKLTSHMLTLTVSGNHEQPYEFAANMLRMPSPEPGPNAPRNRPGNKIFAYRHGFVTYVGLNFEWHNETAPEWKVTNDLLPLSEDEYQYTHSLLKGIDRKSSPWVVLQAHRPLYCTSSDCNYKSWLNASYCSAPETLAKSCGDDALLLRTTAYSDGKTFEDLMLDFNVSVFIGAHVHQYERTHPVTNNGSEWVLPDASSKACAFADYPEDQYCAMADIYEVRERMPPVVVTNGAGGTVLEQLGVSFVGSTPPPWDAARIVTDTTLTISGVGINVKDNGGFAVMKADPTQLAFFFFSAYDHGQYFSDGFVLTKNKTATDEELAAVNGRPLVTLASTPSPDPLPKGFSWGPPCGNGGNGASATATVGHMLPLACLLVAVLLINP
jgi:hypothetical protein